MAMKASPVATGRKMKSATTLCAQSVTSPEIPSQIVNTFEHSDSGKRRQLSVHPTSRESLAVLQPAAGSPKVLVGNNRVSGVTMKTVPTHSASKKGTTALPRRTDRIKRSDANTSKSCSPTQSINESTTTECFHPSALPTSDADKKPAATSDEATWEDTTKALTERCSQLGAENDLLRFENAELERKRDALKREIECAAKENFPNECLTEETMRSKLESLTSYTLCLAQTVQAVKDKCLEQV